jgi:hypothetical protein
MSHATNQACVCDILSTSSLEHPKAILRTSYYVVAALVDHVRLLSPFRHVSIIFAISPSA